MPHLKYTRMKTDALDKDNVLFTFSITDLLNTKSKAELSKLGYLPFVNRRRVIKTEPNEGSAITTGEPNMYISQAIANLKRTTLPEFNVAQPSTSNGVLSVHSQNSDDTQKNNDYIHTAVATNKGTQLTGEHPTTVPENQPTKIQLKSMKITNKRRGHVTESDIPMKRYTNIDGSAITTRQPKMCTSVDIANLKAMTLPEFNVEQPSTSKGVLSVHSQNPDDIQKNKEYIRTAVAANSATQLTGEQPTTVAENQTSKIQPKAMKITNKRRGHVTESDIPEKRSTNIDGSAIMTREPKMCISQVIPNLKRTTLTEFDVAQPSTSKGVLSVHSHNPDDIQKNKEYIRTAVAANSATQLTGEQPTTVAGNQPSKIQMEAKELPKESDIPKLRYSHVDENGLARHMFIVMMNRKLRKLKEQREFERFRTQMCHWLLPELSEPTSTEDGCAIPSPEEDSNIN